MRTDLLKVKLTIPIPFDNPDSNGTVHSKEAVEQAVRQLMTNTPILYADDGTRVVVGSTTGDSHIVAWDNENQVCNVTVEGVLFHGGAGIRVNEIQDGVISDFEIVEFGISR